jgi:hypothetical protein
MPDYMMIVNDEMEMTEKKRGVTFSQKAFCTSLSLA